MRTKAFSLSGLHCGAALAVATLCAAIEPAPAVSALIAFLQSPTAVAALKARGMEVD